jgi:hypothetical protein
LKIKLVNDLLLSSPIVESLNIILNLYNNCRLFDPTKIIILMFDHYNCNSKFLKAKFLTHLINLRSNCFKDIKYIILLLFIIFNINFIYIIK